jgi:hypothetical protein
MASRRFQLDRNYGRMIATGLGVALAGSGLTWLLTVTQDAHAGVAFYLMPLIQTLLHTLQKFVTDNARAPRPRQRQKSTRMKRVRQTQVALPVTEE